MKLPACDEPAEVVAVGRREANEIIISKEVYVSVPVQSWDAEARGEGVRPGHMSKNEEPNSMAEILNEDDFTYFMTLSVEAPSDDPSRDGFRRVRLSKEEVDALRADFAELLERTYDRRRARFGA